MHRRSRRASAGACGGPTVGRAHYIEGSAVGRREGGGERTHPLDEWTLAVVGELGRLFTMIARASIGAFVVLRTSESDTVKLP